NVCAIRALMLEFKFSIDLFAKRRDKVEVSARYRFEFGGALKSLQNLLPRLRPMHVEQNIPDSRHQLGGEIRSIAHELPRKWNRLMNDFEATQAFRQGKILLIIGCPRRHDSIQHHVYGIRVTVTENITHFVRLTGSFPCFLSANRRSFSNKGIFGK